MGVGSTPLPEYLLAWTYPDGSHITRWGSIVTNVPFFPANTTVTFNVFPIPGTYANIYFAHKFSPSIVPGNFFYEIVSRGVVVSSFSVGTLATTEGFSYWIEITRDNPAVAKLANLTALNQFYDAVDFYLTVDSESSLKKVREIFNSYAHSQFVPNNIGVK